jgi:hypothetical protein
MGAQSKTRMTAPGIRGIAMKYRTTLALLVLGLAAALLFFFVERPRQDALDRKAKHEGSLTGVTPDEVQEVAIERPDLSLTALRAGARWRITAPLEDSADDAAFHTLVRTICDAAVERRIEVDEKALPEFGLEPPAAVVRLSGPAGGALLQVRVGGHNVTKSHCYATLGRSTEVLLVPAAVRRYAVRPLFEYRDPRVVDIAIEDVAAIGVSSPARAMTWRFDRRRRYWFTVERGDTVTGDSTAVVAVIRTLRGLRAADIPEDGPARREDYIAPAAGTVVLERTAGSAPLTLRFGAPREGSCFVERSGDSRIALVDAAVLDIFARTVDDLRNRRLLRFAEESLSRVSLETRGRAVTIVRSGTRWTYTNPGFGDIGEDAAGKLLARLKDLRCDRVIEERVRAGKDYGFATPILRLVLADPAGEVIDELRAGAPAPGTGMTYVTSRSAPYVGAIATAPLSGIESLMGGPGPR